MIHSTDFMLPHVRIRSQADLKVLLSLAFVFFCSCLLRVNSFTSDSWEMCKDDCFR